MMLKRFTEFLNREDGHGVTLPAVLLGGAGAVMLGIGAAADKGWLAIAGGIVLAVGLLAASVVNHMMVDYAIYDRLDELEKS